MLGLFFIIHDPSHCITTFLRVEKILKTLFGHKYQKHNIIYTYNNMLQNYYDQNVAITVNGNFIRKNVYYIT